MPAFMSQPVSTGGACMPFDFDLQLQVGLGRMKESLGDSEWVEGAPRIFVPVRQRGRRLDVFTL